MIDETLGASPGAVTYAPSGALGSNADLKADLKGYCRRIRVGVAGNLEIVCADGTTVVIYNVQVGEPIDLLASMIKAGANTTAQQITCFKLPHAVALLARPPPPPALAQRRPVSAP